MAPVQTSPAIPPKEGTSRNAIMALVFGIVGAVPLLFGWIGGGLFGDAGGNVAGALVLLGLASSITAIVFGVMGMRDANRYTNAGASNAMAITGLVLGILGSLVGVVMAVVVVLFFALCAACAAGASTTSAAFATPWSSFAGWAKTTWRNVVREPGRVLLAHHPDCAAFHDDVARVGSTKVCAGCIGVIAGTVIAAAALRAFGEPDLSAMQWLTMGVLLALVGTATSFLRLSLRPQGRALARVPIGLGIVAFAQGLFLLPTSAAVAAFAAAALASCFFGAMRIATMRARLDALAHA